MSSIERIRCFPHEYLDVKEKTSIKLYPILQHQCLHEVGIMVDDAVKLDGIRKYEAWFQLAFTDGEDWELQTKYLQCGKQGSKGSKTKEV